ncbi:MAG TPA: TraB/GumN family protein [Vicinamibacteria bacterium]|nr:TraB/GumN family protein [Vicinamibacteria bacterium]
MTAETDKDLYPPDQVQVIHIDGRDFILVGTAHVSMGSADLVREVIEREKPDHVAVELDEKRYQALTERDRWESLDIREIIRKKQLATLIVNLLLAAYQKRLGLKLGVMPGTELLEAVRTAEKNGIPVTLADRDVRVTLRRAWRAMSLWRKSFFLSALLASLFDEKELTEGQVQELLKRDVLSELMRDLGDAMPELKTVLIDERDLYLSHRIRQSPGRRVVAVVGAGHIEGIRKALLESREADVEELNRIPPVSPAWKWIGWSLPIAILGSIGYIGWTKGPEAAGDSALFWILASGTPCALGAILAFAHPLTVLAAFVSAPITTLSPVLGAGYVTAFVQAFVRPPRVKEFQTVAEDVTHLKRWWQSRLLRVFLAFLLPSVGASLGMIFGSVEIFGNLFS